jgi:hypothetical protein
MRYVGFLLAALALAACSGIEYTRFDPMPIAGAPCAARVYDRQGDAQ